MPDQDSEEEKDIDWISPISNSQQKDYVETKMETTKDFLWSLKHRNQDRKQYFYLIPVWSDHGTLERMDEFWF